MKQNKIITLLSSKSSGSSAFQNYLMEHFGVCVLKKTTHYENETLFWTKAASALNLPQEKMHRSVVPYPRKTGARLLNYLLLENNVRPVEAFSQENIMNAFKMMALQYGPVYFEKSPHHLFNYSNVELIVKCREQLVDEFNFHMVALVRNPLDTIYSAWSRWKYNSKAFEREWYQSYSNLEKFSKEVNVTIFRYEDIVNDHSALDDYCTAIGLTRTEGNFIFSNLHVKKWQHNKFFRHQLNRQTIELAIRLGYEEGDLKMEDRKGNIIWEMVEWLRNGLYNLRHLRRGE